MELTFVLLVITCLPSKNHIVTNIFMGKGKFNPMED
jgi:hypothetical protein